MIDRDDRFDDILGRRDIITKMKEEGRGERGEGLEVDVLES